MELVRAFTWSFVVCFVLACTAAPADKSSLVGTEVDEQGGDFDDADGDGPADDGADEEMGDDDPPDDPGVELNAGFVGGACQNADDCMSADFSQEALCVTSDFPNGMCTQGCTQTGGGTYICPDTEYGVGTGNTITRCIDAGGEPRCVSQCDFEQSPTGCRPGYRCVLRERYAQETSIFAVCLPADLQRWPGEPLPTVDIGDACASAGDCEHLACLGLTGGYCTKTLCEYAGCPSGSSCFEVDGDTACLKDCDGESDCRSDGYACDADYDICWPEPTMADWDPDVGASDCATAWGTAGSGLSTCDTVKDDYIVVRKSARNLALCHEGGVVANYHAGLGFAPVGDKEREGDGKTPEGVFYVPYLVPDSSYYQAFLLSYPDKTDASRGLAEGLIDATEKAAIDAAQDDCVAPPQFTELGGLIEIHGAGGGEDWTLGCIALDNDEIDVLWDTIVAGDTVVVLP